jgi:RHS repeat-associated protein
MGYDPVGNQTSHTKPDGNSNAFTFDVLNRLKTVASSHETGGAKTEYQFDNIGLRTVMTLPNGLRVDYSYNSVNHLTGITQKQGVTTIGSYSYSLDKVGNKKEVAELGGSSYKWLYDDAYRLISETAQITSPITTLYQYDKTGNRESMKIGSSTPVTYSYNNLDQLTSTSFGKHYYDARGNLINSSGVSQYQYDAMDRLITATVSGGTARYDYDHDGRRIKQTIGVTVTNYLWDEISTYGDVVLETNSSGAFQASYTTGQACVSCDVSGLISQKSGSTVSYYLKDGQGNVRALTNPSGGFVSGESYRYNAYGELQSGQTNPASKYLYTGQQFDSLTGLYSLRARYYNPSQGRFNSRDTFRVNFNNPIELNRYGYTAENPLNASDPSGLDTGVAGLAQPLRLPKIALPSLKGFGSAVAILTVAIISGFLIGVAISSLYQQAAQSQNFWSFTVAVAIGTVNKKLAIWITMNNYYHDPTGIYATHYPNIRLFIQSQFSTLLFPGGVYFEGGVSGNPQDHAEQLLITLINSTAGVDDPQKIPGAVSGAICADCAGTAQRVQFRVLPQFVRYDLTPPTIQLYLLAKGFNFGSGWGW